MKIAFYPKIEKSENAYTTAVIEAIKLADPKATVISFPPFKQILKNKFDFNIAWLNWFENLPNKKYFFLKELIIKLLVLHNLKKKRTKIFTTFHNKKPHDSIFPKLNFWFYKYLLKKSDKIIILSDDSKHWVKELIKNQDKNKIIKISHPAYKINIKKDIDHIKQFSILFFGVIRPYKNIELIIKLAKENPNIYFTIAGKPLNDEYLKEIYNLSVGLNNIRIIPKYQNDEDLEKLMSENTIAILPYNINSSLNSGALFYAFSNGLNAIVPDIASVNEFENKKLIYHYKPENEKEEFKLINKQLIQAYNDFSTNPTIFFEKSKILQNEVSKFSPQFLADQIKNYNLLS